MRGRRPVLRRGIGGLVALGLVFVTLLVSWHALAKVDFLYALWYPTLEIEAHIAHYAARNVHGKQDFVRTDPAEHRRLFGAMVQGIHGRGEPLDQLVYRDEQGVAMGIFLRADEVGHLEDVAGLVRGLQLAGWTITAATVLLLVLQGRQGVLLPTPRAVLLALGLAWAVGGAVLAWVGPQQVFDRLHEWIFASGHPWFFYYEDSLMTTVMKAPDIFAAIVAIWLGVQLLLYLLVFAGLRHYTQRHHLPPDPTAR